MIVKLKSLLDSCFSIPGDYIYFRPYKGDTLSYIIDAAKTQNKKTYYVETFNGLPEPTKKDLSLNKHFLHNKGAYTVSKDFLENKIKSLFPTYTEHYPYDDFEKIPKEAKFCFAFLDEIFYEQSKKTLDYIWENISYGGTIFIPRYENAIFSSDLAITEFINEKKSNVIVSRQMIVNACKEKFLIIKCFNENNKPLTWTKPILENKKITIALVLKNEGNVYNYNYVNAIANAIRKNTTKNIEIVCLTDNPAGFNRNINKIIPLKHNFPKWWSKIELFRPDIFDTENVFYFDLDTLIIDNIDEILDLDFDFCALRDFYKLVNIGSGLMAWNTTQVYKIYEEFLKKSKFIITTYTDGDQQWIDQNKPRTVYFQDIFPKEIISFKKDCLKKDNIVQIPDKAKIICFHGMPRPHMVTDQLIKNYWQP